MGADNGHLVFTTAGSERLRIHSNGELSHGTTIAPNGIANTRFEQTIQIANWSSSTGADVVGNIAGILYLKSSDRRLKKQIRDSKYGLQDIMKLRPRDYIIKETGRVDTGFIAQEVQNIIPEAIPENQDGYLGFRGDPIISALVSAVQELKDEVDELRTPTITSILKRRLTCLFKRLQAG
jgi:hypothetical protein